MNNLYDSVNAMKIWKTIVSHTSCIMKSFGRLYDFIFAHFPNWVLQSFCYYAALFFRAGSVFFNFRFFVELVIYFYKVCEIFLLFFIILWFSRRRIVFTVLILLKKKVLTVFQNFLTVVQNFLVSVIFLKFKLFLCRFSSLHIYSFVFCNFG